MFDIGFGEIIIISVIALIVAGPERLPGMLRTVGVWINRVRRMVNNVKSEIEREISAEELRRSLAESQSLIEELKQKASLNSDLLEVDSTSSSEAKPSESDLSSDQSKPDKNPSKVSSNE